MAEITIYNFLYVMNCKFFPIKKGNISFSMSYGICFVYSCSLQSLCNKQMEIMNILSQQIFFSKSSDFFKMT